MAALSAKLVTEVASFLMTRKSNDTTLCVTAENLLLKQTR